ncbi:APC family permease [Solihabitans fulvus]|uniref:APC family permease n=1 Tax=Solihabitans fulvus TaxID=1892852 RepID=A0A5B2WS49_9PSEU|nr:APC family permease [Solihabitans fulvus]KAA2253814.1 APC family permease [Solihabitans fulvus]
MTDASKAGSELHKTLTVTKGVGVALSMIIGSGLLVLPGLAYATVGPSAIYAWLIAALVVLPLLLIFAHLGARYPTAGGVQGFAQAAFGATGSAVTSMILLGACAFGGAAMAVTGGNYVVAVFDRPGLAGWAAGGYLVLICLLQSAGSRLAGGVQTVVAMVLLVLLALVAFVPVFASGAQLHGEIAPPSHWAESLPAIGLIFFAYNGWELVSSTAEEYRNPRRDFPLVIGITFVVVVAVYVGIAVAVQATLSQGDPQLAHAPLVAVLSQVVGGASGQVAAVLGALIIFATLMGGTWATSRIVFATARERLLPPVLARVHDGSGAPRPAIVVSGLMFGAVVVAYSLGALSLALVFRLAAVNFVVGYGIAVASYAKLTAKPGQRLLAVLAGVPVLALLAGFGWLLLYPAALVAWAGGRDVIRRRRLARAT